MKIKCPKCESENLDQGTDGSILCHSCKGIFTLNRKYGGVAEWV